MTNQPSRLETYTECSPEERLERFAELFNEIRHRAAERLAQQNSQPNAS